MMIQTYTTDVHQTFQHDQLIIHPTFCIIFKNIFHQKINHGLVLVNENMPYISRSYTNSGQKLLTNRHTKGEGDGV